MRLYVNRNEIEALKYALRNVKCSDSEMRAKQLAVLERVVLCEQLQGNIDKAEAAK